MGVATESLFTHSTSGTVRLLGLEKRVGVGVGGLSTFPGPAPNVTYLLADSFMLSMTTDLEIHLILPTGTATPPSADCRLRSREVVKLR